LAGSLEDIHPAGVAGDASRATAEKGRATAEHQAEGLPGPAAGRPPLFARSARSIACRDAESGLVAAQRLVEPLEGEIDRRRQTARRPPRLAGYRPDSKPDSPSMIGEPSVRAPTVEPMVAVPMAMMTEVRTPEQIDTGRQWASRCAKVGPRW
jgi:hypothetical protein